MQGLGWVVGYHQQSFANVKLAEAVSSNLTQGTAHLVAPLFFPFGAMVVA